MSQPTNGAKPAEEPRTEPGRQYPLHTPDAWVVFHDPEDLTGNDHRRIAGGLKINPNEVAALKDSPEALDAFVKARGIGLAMDHLYATTCMLIKAWHVPYTPRDTAFEPGQVPIPSAGDIETLGALRYKDYRLILNLGAPLVREIDIGTEPVTPDDAGVPGSPTVPAGG